MKAKILEMDREEIIDFLSDNWTDLVHQLPTGKVKDYLNRKESDGNFRDNIEDLRNKALKLCT